ncbi:MAG: 1,4-alpha-glucan branching protein GlgB [Clostridia bacterium]|nr:1,4-alpha-glucan branching protein GlgB [Clostridia bacterium]
MIFSNEEILKFHQGECFNAYEYLGAHFTDNGVIFRVWAPRAESVCVVGDFNGWDNFANPMKRISQGGIFETEIFGLKEFDAYKFAVKSNGKTVLKADPYAFHAETPSGTASKIYDLDGYEWGDDEFVNSRTQPYDKPMNVYELNLASWKRKKNGDFYSYLEYADELVKYVKDMGYTHVELMPVSEYPFDGSWGYQVTGYYAVSSRFGTPKDFMRMVDSFHQEGISVIVDWVPGHFPKDEHGLYEFDGSCCYENWRNDRKEHKDWGTRIFDWGKTEVQTFLISNAMFLMDKFHVDGLRVDAVASMLYLDYGRKDGEWTPNEQGGNYNLDAIAFLRKLNKTIFAKYPNALMVAEESTAFPMVTKPIDMGGLGFNFKWNMGWMNDTLSYVQVDPYFRSGSHDKITFSMCYAFSENFVLPISHDEVVHGKKSLVDKMPGDVNMKFSNLRAFTMYMYAHPGKKLSFMGNEFAQFREWNFADGLEFFMLKFDLHKKYHKFSKTINNIYKQNCAFYEIEDSWEGFNWISADERDNNVVSFIRRDKKGKEIVCIINFSGNDYYNYRLGVNKGEYKVILNSDAKTFGGRGVLKGKTFRTVKRYAHGKETSIRFNLPAFTGIYFEKV